MMISFSFFFVVVRSFFLPLILNVLCLCLCMFCLLKIKTLLCFPRLSSFGHITQWWAKKQCICLFDNSWYFSFVVSLFPPFSFWVCLVCLCALKWIKSIYWSGEPVILFIYLLPSIAAMVARMYFFECLHGTVCFFADDGSFATSFLRLVLFFFLLLLLEDNGIFIIFKRKRMTIVALITMILSSLSEMR